MRTAGRGQRDLLDAACIGCGCTDSQACWDDFHGRACHWLRVDREAGKGVCSVCEDHVERWDAGDRAPTAGAK